MTTTPREPESDDEWWARKMREAGKQSAPLPRPLPYDTPLTTARGHRATVIVGLAVMVVSFGVMLLPEGTLAGAAATVAFILGADVSIFAGILWGTRNNQVRGRDVATVVALTSLLIIVVTVIGWPIVFMTWLGHVWH